MNLPLTPNINWTLSFHTHTAPPPVSFHLTGCSLSLDEYIRSCLFLQTAARTFGAFDPQRTGQVHLSFNQFVYAASHVGAGF
jgi:hypothetical protein